MRAVVFFTPTCELYGNKVTGESPDTSVAMWNKVGLKNPAFLLLSWRGDVTLIILNYCQLETSRTASQTSVECGVLLHGRDL